MNTSDTRTRILNPLERFSEILFGLIMVLSFTCAVSIAEAERKDLRMMLIAALGCNLAWGIIDAVFYLTACLVESGRDAMLLRDVQRAGSEEAHRIIGNALPPKIADILQPPDFERIHENLKQLPPPGAETRLFARDWLGGLAVFLLVFLSTFPVVVPFIFVHNVRLAFHLSNIVAITLIFASAHQLAAYAGLRPLRLGLIMVAVGGLLVVLTILLGG
jgi:VIT1/CCC1 family predicted Fe2+/Mn2+ transporter